VHISGLIVDSGGITHFLKATTNNVSMDELVHIDYGISIFIHLFYRLHELPAQILDTPVAPLYHWRPLPHRPRLRCICGEPSESPPERQGLTGRLGLGHAITIEEKYWIGGNVMVVGLWGYED
jgi:hypothetical protein